MNNKIIKILRYTFSILIAVILAIAFLVPFIKLKEKGTTVEYSLFFGTLFGGGSLSSSLMPTISFGGILAIVFFIICPLTALVDNKILRVVSIAGSVATLSVSIQISKTISMLEDELGGSSIAFSKVGSVIFLLGAIFSVIFIIVDSIIYFYGSKIASAFSKRNVSKEELLIENQKLFDQKLISEEEYNERRNKILGV